MVDGKLTRDEKRCIGCGLCMYVCPTDALSIDLRLTGDRPLPRKLNHRIPSTKKWY